MLLQIGEVERGEPRPETVEDRWILSRLERITAGVGELYDGYRFSRAANLLYDAFWGEVCDWYLEFVKPRLYDDDADRSALSATLLHVLERVLVLLHPVMPFVTEEVWSHLPGERGLLAVERWPEPRVDLIDEQAERVVGDAIEAVTALRRYRDDVGAPAAALIPGRLAADGYEETAEQVARLARFELVTNGETDGDVVTSVAIPGGAVQVLPTDAIDTQEAERRRAKRIETLRDEIERAEGKLANERFIEKAPADVVQAERDKLEALRAELERLS